MLLMPKILSRISIQGADAMFIYLSFQMAVSVCSCKRMAMTHNSPRKKNKEESPLYILLFF